MDFIVVSGAIREMHNLMACISGNPLKKRPLTPTGFEMLLRPIFQDGLDQPIILFHFFYFYLTTKT
jgi:hypothetical protein